MSFNTQPPEGGWRIFFAVVVCAEAVSTLSRLKAAGHGSRRRCTPERRFNTQPPEGGWLPAPATRGTICSFNTQPPEGGWCFIGVNYTKCTSGFNTQPPEGGWLAAVIGGLV